MKLPWPSRSTQEIERADVAVEEVKLHLRVLLAELRRTLDEIDEKAGR